MLARGIVPHRILHSNFAEHWMKDAKIIESRHTTPLLFFVRQARSHQKILEDHKVCILIYYFFIDHIVDNVSIHID